LAASASATHYPQKARATPIATETVTYFHSVVVNIKNTQQYAVRKTANTCPKWLFNNLGPNKEKRLTKQENSTEDHFLQIF
jgi:hypothetical protein